MKILYFTNCAFSKFPSYKRATGTGTELARLGHRVFIALEDCEENRQRFPIEAPGCEALWVKAGNPICEAWHKLRMLWEIQPDYLYSLSYSFRNLQFMSWLFPRKTRYILEVCELYSAYRFMWKFKEWMMIVEADRLLCASRYLARVFMRRIFCRHIGRCQVLYQPYAYPRYLVPNDVPKRDAVVYVAYMSKGYGCIIIMEAFERIHEKHSGVVLEMLGTGPDFNEMKRWVDEHRAADYIHLRGYVPEAKLNNYFSRALVFMAPMRNAKTEIARCPSKMFYYLPFEKPIVTCKIGNPYDILGENGYYYKPLDVADMANALDCALRDSRTFKYPSGFMARHSWEARAIEFAKWLEQ